MKTKRILLKIQYDGTNYYGFQKQNNGLPSIEEELEKVISKVVNHEVKIVGCGRTDKGVSARNYYLHFDTTSIIEPQNYAHALNVYLPDDIQVIESSQIKNGTHVRYDVLNKTYEYNTYYSKCILPLKNRFSLQLYKRPDIEAMKECATLFVGKHDFRSFMTADNQSRREDAQTVRTINFLEIVSDGDDIKFIFNGDGFLYNMVRIIVGTLLEVGYKKRTMQEVKNLFVNLDRKKAGKLIEPRGLILADVEYKK